MKWLRKQLKKDALEDLQYVKEVLQRWDPIGVIELLKQTGKAPDEYESYAPRIVGMLRRGCDEKKLARHLGTIQSVEMGLEPSAERDYKIATELVDWWKSKNEG